MLPVHEKRFWEIDFARGTAVLMMIVFHALFDLEFFAGRQTGVSQGFWWWFARATAALFVFIAGVCLHLSYSRSKKLGAQFVAQKFLRRGTKIFTLGLLITAATFVFLENNGTIWFGVLHFIAVGTIISLLFVSRPKLCLPAGVAAIMLGTFLQNLESGFPWLYWLGVKPAGFYSYDYFPMFPWLGVMLLGIWFGSLAYPAAERKFKFLDLSEPKNLASKVLRFAGRNSLAIYFLHQPALIALVFLARAGGLA